MNKNEVCNKIKERLENLSKTMPKTAEESIFSSIEAAFISGYVACLDEQDFESSTNIFLEEAKNVAEKFLNNMK